MRIFQFSLIHVLSIVRSRQLILLIRHWVNLIIILIDSFWLLLLFSNILFSRLLRLILLLLPCLQMVNICLHSYSWLNHSLWWWLSSLNRLSWYQNILISMTYKTNINYNKSKITLTTDVGLGKKWLYPVLSNIDLLRLVNLLYLLAHPLFSAVFEQLFHILFGNWY